MQLNDKTGVIDGKVWDINNGIDHFDSMDYIKVDAQVISYQGALQLNIRRVRKADEGEYNPADYMPYTKKNIDEMFARMTALIDSVKEPHLLKLLKMFFVEDQDFAGRFKMHSAAKTMHHNFVGGLLQHSLAVAELCDFYAANYEQLNRDLLITAAICHDIGKLDEISDNTDAKLEGFTEILEGAVIIRMETGSDLTGCLILMSEQHQNNKGGVSCMEWKFNGEFVSV